MTSFLVPKVCTAARVLSAAVVAIARGSVVDLRLDFQGGREVG
jgi:hypothetical protein